MKWTRSQKIKSRQDYTSTHAGVWDRCSTCNNSLVCTVFVLQLNEIFGGGRLLRNRWLRACGVRVGVNHCKGCLTFKAIWKCTPSNRLKYLCFWCHLCLQKSTSLFNREELSLCAAWSDKLKDCWNFLLRKQLWERLKVVQIPLQKRKFICLLIHYDIWNSRLLWQSFFLLIN